MDDLKKRIWLYVIEKARLLRFSLMVVNRG